MPKGIVPTLHHPWIICLSSSLFFFYVIFQMSFFNTISHEIMTAFQLTSVQLSFLSSLYFYADALFLLPAGILLDRFSTRTILLLSMAFCVVSMFVFTYTESIVLIGLCRSIWGIGNAFAFLGSMRLVSIWFIPQRNALVMGILVTIGMMGGIVAQTPFSLLVEFIGWQKGLLVFAIVGIIIWSILYFSVFDKEAIEQNETKDFLQSLKTAFSQTQNWLCGLYAACLNLPILVLGALWGNFYLQTSKHISAMQASVVITFLFIGLIIGAPIIGSFSDKMLS